MRCAVGIVYCNIEGAHKVQNSTSRLNINEKHLLSTFIITYTVFYTISLHEILFELVFFIYYIQYISIEYRKSLLRDYR